MSLMADTIAGRFALLDPIATGGSGTVWFAHDLKLDSVCAAKVLRQRDSADLLRFVRENSVRIDHPHVLAPYAWAAEDADVVLAMPIITGGSLSGVLGDHGPLSPALTAEILRQMLDGLAHIHASGWIHRDLKPANIMVDAEVDYPHVLIADFGIAVHRNDPRLTETGVVYGTPGFLAPEVLHGSDPATAQDLWALGSIGWALLGATPRSGLSERERIRDEVLQASPNAATAALLDTLAHMMAANPLQRPTAEAARDAIPSPESTIFHSADGEVFTPLRVLELPPLQPPNRPTTPAAGPTPPLRTLVLPSRPGHSPAEARDPYAPRQPPPPGGWGGPAPSVSAGPVPSTFPPGGGRAGSPADAAGPARTKRLKRRRGWWLASGLGLAGIALIVGTLIAEATGLL